MAERRSSGGKARRTSGLAACVVALFMLTPVEPMAEEQKELKPEDKVVREFLGEVKEIVLIHEYSGKAILAHFDARFVVRIAVVRPVEGGPEMKEKELVYAIHSVVQTFPMLSRDEVVGKTFHFRETQTESLIAGKKVISRWLKVVKTATGATEQKKGEQH
ncbi:MAG: hypothetical protein NTW87_04395 [Planctomycetota bacterium]|nr:hypothetical protein [Planctomycetota bacterium]